MTAYVKAASVPPHLVDDRDPPAIAQLKEDHQILRALFDLVETVGDDVLFPIAGEICIRLAIHMNLEEEFLYPSLRAVIGGDEIDDAIMEHQLAKRLILQIMEMSGRAEPLRAKIHDLGAEVIRHIDEEDRELFRHARKTAEAGKIDLVEIEIEMERRRRDLFTLVGSASVKTPAFDVDLDADAIERLPQSGSEVDGEAWPEFADAGATGRHSSV